MWLSLMKIKGTNMALIDSWSNFHDCHHDVAFIDIWSSCEIEWWRTGWLQLEPPFLFSNNHRRERWFSVSTEPMRGIDVWLFQVNLLNIVGSLNSQYDFPKKMDHPKRVHSNNTCHLPPIKYLFFNPYSPRYRHQKERCYNLESPDFGRPHPSQVAPGFRHSCWIDDWK